MSFYRDYNDKLAQESWNTRATPDYKTIEVKRISPSLGAEVIGIDLSKELSSDQLDDVRKASADNLVLVFRGQDIATEDHKRFAEHFGTLHRHVSAGKRAPGGDPEVLAWKTSKASRFTAGEAWHNDVSCDPEPITESFLRITRLPESGGGDTAFANMYLAYDSLSDGFKKMLDGLTAIHSGEEGWTNGYGDKPVTGTQFTSAEHPVVAIHPVTKRRFLFVNRAFTSRIVQLSRAESDAVLEFIYRHIETHLSFQTRIRWEQNTLIYWDNWATQHQAVWDYFPYERWGERVSSISGKKPVMAEI